MVVRLVSSVSYAGIGPSPHRRAQIRFGARWYWPSRSVVVASGSLNRTTGILSWAAGYPWLAISASGDSRVTFGQLCRAKMQYFGKEVRVGQKLEKYEFQDFARNMSLRYLKLQGPG